MVDSDPRVTLPSPFDHLPIVHLSAGATSDLGRGNVHFTSMSHEVAWLDEL